MVRRSSIGLAVLVAALSIATSTVAACGSSEGTTPPSEDEPSIANGDASVVDPADGSNGPKADSGVDGNTTRFVDDCERATKKGVCTALPAAFGDGKGLEPIDRCAHALGESDDFGATPAILTALEKLVAKVSPIDLVADANRAAIATTTIPGSPANVKIGFRWKSDDDNSEAWIPQGISGSADADPSGLVDGKRIVLVSFYDAAPDGAPDRGVRVAFVDMTNPAAPMYRFALLVALKGSAEAPSFGLTNVHAGGIVWFGDYLYVADTSRGFRVFDMRHILRVDDGEQTLFGCEGGKCAAAGYKYVVPQVGAYTIESECKPLFSFVSLDRESDPPALVSGEYCSGTACASPFAGRILRWPLDPTGRLRSAKTYPTEAYYMGRTQVQGGASSNGTFYLSSSQPAASGGILFRTNAEKKNGTSSWSDAPEDLMVDGKNKLLWSLSEAAGARTVYGVDMTKFPSL